MIFVDTSFLLAVLNPRDTLHPRAQAWADVVAERLLITEYVIWEMVNGLSMPADRPKAYLAVREAGSDWEWVPASDPLFIAGIRLHRERDDKAWSLTDCISFQIMQQRNIRRALTYDHHYRIGGLRSTTKTRSALIEPGRVAPAFPGRKSWSRLQTKALKAG